MGEPYVDGSGLQYLPMFGHPVLVFAADAAALARAAGRARARGLATAVYTDDLFATDNDVDNRAAVAKVATADLALAGLAMAGPRRDGRQGGRQAAAPPLTGTGGWSRPAGQLVPALSHLAGRFGW